MLQYGQTRQTLQLSLNWSVEAQCRERMSQSWATLGICLCHQSLMSQGAANVRKRMTIWRSCCCTTQTSVTWPSLLPKCLADSCETTQVIHSYTLLDNMKCKSVSEWIHILLQGAGCPLAEASLWVTRFQDLWELINSSWLWNWCLLNLYWNRGVHWSLETVVGLICCAVVVFSWHRHRCQPW